MYLVYVNNHLTGEHTRYMPAKRQAQLLRQMCSDGIGICVVRPDSRLVDF